MGVNENLLAQAIKFMDANNFPAAETALQSLAVLEPDNPEVLFQYGKALIKTGKPLQAEQHLRKAVLTEPDNLDYQAEVALALFHQGRQADALNLLQNILHKSTGNLAAHKNLGIIYLNSGNDKEAVTHFQIYLDNSPDGDALAFLLYGSALVNLHMYYEARGAFGKAISLSPRAVWAHYNLASVLERLGEYKEARAIIENARTEFPKFEKFKTLDATVLRREKKYGEAIALLRDLKTTAPHLFTTRVQQQLAYLYDLTNDTDAAFKEFTSFNRRAASEFGISKEQNQKYISELDRLKNTYTKTWVKSWKNISSDAASDPVFLVGFPRSGTTLLQKVLDSHSSVYAADEVLAIEEIVGMWNKEISDLNKEDIKAAKDVYYKFHQEAPQWREKKVFVDKLPLAFLNAGVIHRVFPSAKFIFALRHPYDCVLSGYMQLFTPNESMAHFYDLNDLVIFYQKALDLWQQYETTLNLNVHYVKYEDVIDDFQPTITGMLKFIGLRWQKSLMDYHKPSKSQAVSTPSYHQVQQPLYKHAQYRWLRYRKHLQPYIPQLAPYAERFGYPIE